MMANETKETQYFGKYREIIIAVAFFLIFDLAVLVLNFYISFQISEDAVAINMAGRQRMLTQRMIKALLTVKSDLQVNLPVKDSLAELGKTAGLFDSTLSAFKAGGQVMGGNEQMVSLQAVATTQSKATLNQADMIWREYYRLLKPLLMNQSLDSAALQSAAAYARANNLTLLKLMNDLTTQLEQAASKKANTLRMIQTVGIFLALLNFAFILFKFIRRLNENDKKVAQAQNETAEILSTVKDGLFLLDSDFKIGSQRSDSLPKILGREVMPGTDLREMLRAMIPIAELEVAIDYIGLVMSENIKESLIGDLNPLGALQVMVTDDEGNKQNRTLKFDFSRVMQDGKISHLLVTVVDITTQVELQNALEEAKQTAKAEMEVMIDLMKIHPITLDNFLNNTEAALLEVNDYLRSAGAHEQYRTMVVSVFRKIHTLKGDAAALGLEMFETLANEFELKLSDLRNKGEITGDDLIALPFPLEDFLERITVVRNLMKRLSAYNAGFVGLVEGDDFVEGLFNLSQRIAEEQGKQVSMLTDLVLLKRVPNSLRQELKEVMVQMLRNAVVHGIELPEEREKYAKDPIGLIQISIRYLGGDEYALMLQDDGAGLVPSKIKSMLIDTKRYSQEYLDELSDKQIVMKIFESGFSTAETVTRDAGHGVGMDVVKAKIESLGARLRIATTPTRYTKFQIVFSI